jgi:RNA polymerase sigma factor (sigma-70 family)
LVHLLRHAFRTGNGRLRDVVLNPLLKRCERLLKNKIPDDRPNAEELREAVLGKFTELLARDANDTEQTELDYYEIRFNDAFRKLRISFLRSEKNTRACLPLPVDADEGQADVDPECVSRLFKSTGQALSPEDALTRKELCDAVDALPPDEQRAVVLHFFYGLKIDSVDPNERTVASVCGVDEKTIRNRLKRALQRLKEKF